MGPAHPVLLEAQNAQGPTLSDEIFLEDAVAWRGDNNGMFKRLLGSVLSSQDWPTAAHKTRDFAHFYLQNTSSHFLGTQLRDSSPSHRPVASKMTRYWGYPKQTRGQSLRFLKVTFQHDTPSDSRPFQRYNVYSAHFGDLRWVTLGYILGCLFLSVEDSRDTQ